MRNEPPTCTLSPDRRQARFEQFAELADRALIEAARTPAGARLRLHDRPDVRATLWPLIEAERRCCSFLRFEVVPDEGSLLVEVSGPPAAGPLIERLFALRD